MKAIYATFANVAIALLVSISPAGAAEDTLPGSIPRIQRLSEDRNVPPTPLLRPFSKPEGWNVSVSTGFVATLDDGGVAHCGPSGNVVYVSGNQGRGRPMSAAYLDLTLMDLRTRANASYRLTLPLQDWDINRPDGIPSSGRPQRTFDVTEDRGYVMLACSDDARKVLVLLKSGVSREHYAVRYLLVDLRAQKVMDLGQAHLSRNIELVGDWIDPGFNTILIPGDKKPDAIKSNLTAIPTDSIAEEIGRVFSVPTRARILIRKGQAWILVEPADQGPRERVLFNFKLGNNGLDAGLTKRHCRISQLLPRSAPQLSAQGIALLASTRDKPELVEIFDLDIGVGQGGECGFKGSGKPIRTDPRTSPVFLVTRDLLVLPTAKLPAKSQRDQKFSTRFEFRSRDGAQKTVVITQDFAGRNELEAFIWTPLYVGQADQFTFLYLPGGRGTTFVHIWDRNLKKSEAEASNKAQDVLTAALRHLGADAAAAREPAGRIRAAELRTCLSGIRAEMLPCGSPEYLGLKIYLAWRAQGLLIETPGVRR